MTAATIEVEELDLASLDDTPRCSALINREGDKWKCENPAVVRIFFKCRCGAAGHDFLCQICFDALKNDTRLNRFLRRVNQRVRCNACHNRNFTWKES